MIYCLCYYNIPLFWNLQLHSCKSCDLLQQRLGLPQTAGKWYLHLGTLSITWEDQTTQEADEWWELSGGTEKLGCWEITESYSHLLLSLLFLARPPKPADAALTAQPELAPAQGAGSRATPAQRQAGVWEAFADEWGLHAHTWGTETPWHPCAGHLLVETIRKTCHCSAICSSS